MVLSWSWVTYSETATAFRIDAIGRIQNWFCLNIKEKFSNKIILFELHGYYKLMQVWKKFYIDIVKHIQI